MLPSSETAARTVTNANAVPELDQPGAVPMKDWGKDHWSTFAYIETRIVDYGGVPNREHMRCNAKIHPGLTNSANRMFSSDKEYPTRLKTGQKQDHDDWSCLDDAESAGLLLNIGTGVNPVFKLTPLGQTVAAQLREFKAKGGQFRDFVPAI